ncbi:hypothetical protein SHVI106290_12395 [Shewanella violacea]
MTAQPDRFSLYRFNQLIADYIPILRFPAASYSHFLFTSVYPFFMIIENCNEL